MPTNFTFGQSFAQGFSDARRLKQQAQQFALQQVLDFARLDESKRSSVALEGIRSDQVSIQSDLKDLQELIFSEGEEKRSLDIKGQKLDLRGKEVNVEELEDKQRFFEGDSTIGIMGMDLNADALRFVDGFLQANVNLQGQASQRGISQNQIMAAADRQFEQLSALSKRQVQSFIFSLQQMQSELIGRFAFEKEFPRGGVVPRTRAEFEAQIRAETGNQ